MFDKKDQLELSKAYTTILENILPSSKPVIVTMDLPSSPVTVNDGEESHHEHDASEIEMALAELHKVQKYAPKLSQLVSDMPSLEGWVASKITKAADYLSSVYHWLEYESRSSENCACSSKSDMFKSGYEDSTCEYAQQGCKCGMCSDCQ